MRAAEALLVRHGEAARRFLAAAVALDRPERTALVAAGVRDWDARAWLPALTEGLIDGTWKPDARSACQTLLAPAPSLLETLAEGDRPREKALRDGIDALDDAELIALLLRTGVGDEDVLELAQRLLAEHEGLVGLARRRTEELLDAHGLGPAKATALAAACELGRRLASAALRERPRLDGPESVAALLAPLATGLAHEEFWCLPLDSRNRLIGTPRRISQGDIDGTEAGPRAFFRIALASGAVAAIAVHNHPSGDPSPSAGDRAVTKRLVAAGRLVEVPLQDHLILGDGGRHVSLRRDEPELWR
jgi:DNA repair protein RadC